MGDQEGRARHPEPNCGESSPLWGQEALGPGGSRTGGKGSCQRPDTDRPLPFHGQARSGQGVACMLFSLPTLCLPPASATDHPTQKPEAPGGCSPQGRPPGAEQGRVGREQIWRAVGTCIHRRVIREPSLRALECKSSKPKQVPLPKM